MMKRRLVVKCGVGRSGFEKIAKNRKKTSKMVKKRPKTAKNRKKCPKMAQKSENINFRAIF